MNSPSASEAVSEIQCGVTFGFYARRGVFGSPWAKEQVRKMKDLGVEWVCLTPLVFQETWTSTRQFLDFEESPGEFETRLLIDFIHEYGLKVFLRPMTECHDGCGRLQIFFCPDRERIPGKRSSHWADWFRSFRARTAHFASLAQDSGCELFGLDSELDRTVDRNKEWLDVIEVARSRYSGPVTSCHTHNVFDFEKILEREDHWFRSLDLLQTSFYFPAASKPGASLEEMIAALKTPLELYRRIAAKLGKPIAFGECGCTSSTGGAMHPSAWSGDGSYSPSEQANYLEAVWCSFQNEPWWRGLYWWKWDEQNKREQFVNDPAGDKGFTVDGKPAAETMRRCFGGLK
jgi:hypothetical protein